ncbi:hypothetical protein VHUM_00300 [Vanrija humicola]|uniref:Uncharacterized protein n=1 Tax=Vanrija humicola TaxID=5417 RepID=A0A7D8V4K3_VANHU|nr:hypothetical protein VHUM_00300 [Vanrija humicola]
MGQGGHWRGDVVRACVDRPAGVQRARRRRAVPRRRQHGLCVPHLPVGCGPGGRPRRQGRHGAVKVLPRD